MRGKQTENRSRLEHEGHKDNLAGNRLTGDTHQAITGERNTG